ncbi:MAG: hypothetical protein M1812_006205 [Candelaria pacifica]|nr:MAG: hypothetical protein M1812_006205 [Candelaria pacifica]
MDNLSVRKAANRGDSFPPLPPRDSSLVGSQRSMRNAITQTDSQQPPPIGKVNAVSVDHHAEQDLKPLPQIPQHPEYASNSYRKSGNRISQPRSRGVIPIGEEAILREDFAAPDNKPLPLRPRRRDSLATVDRKRQNRFSQTRSRWSIPPASLANIQQAIPSMPPEKPGRKGKSWRFFLAFFALSVVAFTSALDATSLSIALPIVAKDLDGTSLESFWAGISFLLASIVFQPVCTSCSDIFGRKPVLYVCIGVFGLGSILFGIARNMGVLILGRTIQGVGGGGLEALSEIILTDMTTLKERALWIGILGFVWAAGSVMGPLLGGAFSEYASWRWIGWFNLPLMGLAVVLIPPFLKLAPIKLSMKAKLKALDWIGIPLFMIGMTSFVFGLTAGGVLFPWKSYKTLLPLILGIGVLLGFVAYESQPKEPMIPYRIFANSTGAIAIVTALLHGVLLFGVLFYLPIYFEAVVGDKPLRGAVEALALSLTVTPFAIIAAFAIDYIRKYCWAVWAGWILTTIGMGLMSMLTLGTKQADRIGLQIMLGIGLGILYPALSIPMQASVNVDDSGLAIGTFVFARQMGAVVGLAIGSAIFTNLFNHKLPDILPDKLFGLSQGNAGISLIPELRHLGISSDDLAPVLLAYADALRGVWYALTAIAAIAFIATLFMKDLSLESEMTGKQAFGDVGDTASLLSMNDLPPYEAEAGIARRPLSPPPLTPSSRLSPVQQNIDTRPHWNDELADPGAFDLGRRVSQNLEQRGPWV